MVLSFEALKTLDVGLQMGSECGSDLLVSQ